MLRRAGAMTSQCLAGRVRAPAAGWSTSAPAASASRCWYARILSGCADDFSPCRKMHLRPPQAGEYQHRACCRRTNVGSHKPDVRSQAYDTAVKSFRPSPEVHNPRSCAKNWPLWKQAHMCTTLPQSRPMRHALKRVVTHDAVRALRRALFTVTDWVTASVRSGRSHRPGRLYVPHIGGIVCLVPS